MWILKLARVTSVQYFSFPMSLSVNYPTGKLILTFKKDDKWKIFPSNLNEINNSQQAQNRQAEWTEDNYLNVIKNVYKALSVSSFFVDTL